MTKASHIIYNNNSFKFKVVQEAYRSFKSIVLDKTGHVFIKSYKKNEYQLRKIQALYQIIVQCPKIIIENSILILLALTALFLIPSDNVNFTFSFIRNICAWFSKASTYRTINVPCFSDIKKHGADLEDVLKLSIKTSK